MSGARLTRSFTFTVRAKSAISARAGHDGFAPGQPASPSRVSAPAVIHWYGQEPAHDAPVSLISGKAADTFVLSTITDLAGAPSCLSLAPSTAAYGLS